MKLVVINPTQAWHNAHPGGAVGLLELSGVENRKSSPALNERKRAIEAGLRQSYAGFTRPDFNDLPLIAAYRDYYRRFKKSYHVQLQLESIVLKGKTLPQVSPLVDANFMAEVESLVLTAGHDTARLVAPVRIDASTEDDHMAQMDGTERPIRAGDMVMRDAGGISCSIIYGQDNRSPISKATTGVLYVAYAPAGVTAASVLRHFELLEGYIRLFSPDAVVMQKSLLQAGV